MTVKDEDTKNAVTITTHRQSGGTNIGIQNIGSQQRELGDKERQMFEEKMPKGPLIHITSAANDSESTRFANQI